VRIRRRCRLVCLIHDDDSNAPCEVQNLALTAQAVAVEELQASDDDPVGNFTKITDAVITIVTRHGQDMRPKRIPGTASLVEGLIAQFFRMGEPNDHLTIRLPAEDVDKRRNGRPGLSGPVGM
jgi:hypothetical protein